MGKCVAPPCEWCPYQQGTVEELFGAGSNGPLANRIFTEDRARYDELKLEAIAKGIISG